MPYTVAAGSIMEVTFEGVHNSQTVMSVLHYRFATGSAITDGRAACVSMNTVQQAATGLYFSWINACGNQLLGALITSQWIKPVRYSAVTTSPATNTGQVAEPCYPQNVAMAITKTADEASRRARGTLHMPAVPLSWIDEGQVTAAGILGYAGVKAEVFENVVLGTGQTMVPVIYNRATPDLSIVCTGAILQETSRTMRRRTVRVGI